jgi:hypothetical protein
MKILEKIIKFFVKTKKLAQTIEYRINKFVKIYKKEILMTMSILETIFPTGMGAKKMRCVVTNICTALGYENMTDEVTNFVTSKCQEIYDEFKLSITNEL